ncbi:MAG: threonine--tRNA ligase [Nanoarchaeota archaeon]
MKVNLTFPDGATREFPSGIKGAEIAQGISRSLAKVALAIKLDDAFLDLSHPITKDGVFKILTFADAEGREVFWHSSAHLMANAILQLFPEAKLAIGPAVENGFYYDIERKEHFKEEDFVTIEAKMAELVKKDMPFVRKEMVKEKALELFRGNRFKEELLAELGDSTVSVYENDGFLDLCRGPHVPSTGMIKAFRLTKLAGAYWRGDAKNQQLQRIYGISFPDRKQLEEHFTMLEEAEKRDHRKIGQQLELFGFEESAPGMVFWHPKGMVLWEQVLAYWREEHRKAGYQEVRTPVIMKKALWLQSGHWDHYKENMYFTKIDDVDYAIKPMNCPGGILVYKSRNHSYKEFPLRVAELGLVHRHELTGVLSGLFRVRSFTQDDAHLYVLPEQLQQEIRGVIQLIDRMYKTFGFSYLVELSTMPDDSDLNKELVQKAEAALRNALDDLKMSYKLNPGDGAFYGPKIDFHIKDCIGRTWQCGTLQCDFSMPEKFDLTYMGADGTENHRPIMLHRTVYGSIERFIGVLTEHFAGKFPLWLSPVQVRIITVADRFQPYAKKVFDAYFAAGIRVGLDESSETVSYKVRQAQLDKVNYILVVGEREEKDNTVTVRTREGKVEGAVASENFLERLRNEIEGRQ